MSFLILVGKENIKIGELERRILEILFEKGSKPVADLYFFICYERHKKKDDNLYNSVCRAVRNLKKKGLVETYKIPAKDFYLEKFRFGRYGRKPTYVKMVELNQDKAVNFI